MKVDAAALDAASDEIFAAALDPTRWSQILQSISDASGSYGINIVPITGRFPGSILATESLAGAMEAYFDEGWNTNDFRAAQLPRLQRQGMMLEQEYAGREQFETLDYYRSQARFGLRWTAMLGFSSGDGQLCFVLQRRIEDGPFEPEEQRLFAGMRDKLMLSASVMRHVHAGHIGGMAEAFDMANVACVFFDRTGRVTTANGKARRLMGGDIDIARGEIRARRPEDTIRLNKRLQAIVGTGAVLTDNPVILLARTGKRPLTVRFQRLTHSLPDIFSQSVAMALIDDPDEGLTLQPKVLTQMFGLTATETEIALLLAQGLSASEIAERRTISYETVRSHMRAILGKTDTNRQTELAALLARMRLI